MISLDIAGIAISAFFILFILSRGRLKKTDWLLVFINLGIIALLVVDAMFQRQLTSIVFLLLNTIPLYFYPLFLIYALEILQEHVHHRGRWVLLFLPALITSAYVGSDLFILHHYNQTQLEHLYNFPTLGYHLLCKGFPIVFLIAFVWLIKRLNIYSANIKDRYSFIDPIELSWLKRSAWIYIFITVLSLLGVITAQSQILPISSHSVCSAVGICMFLAIFYVSFHGIQQYTIADFYGEKMVSSNGRNNLNAATEITDVNIPTKYKTSSLSNAEQQLIFEKVIRLFDEKKPYLEPKLQLSDIAEALNISTHNLSQTINATTGKPFYDFVNSYRVEHLKKLLEDPLQQKFTILSMGFESGFNSKASLNRVFRQDTGLSPSEYLERHRVKQVSAF
ncbi:helix-turn-helix domain-containing protein [Mucilaginibacter sp. X4EP1]|uniref:helix-turn-helix domain-containing protein n=1 Tax=Mucilaginibacter sp. X4EP1 TaxID=2723092 RepID=UPI00216A7C6A|nr:helix-turn-helix domain-containing protein [Mucilaginibacter sp. X4EP1]MCS3813525.1 AraC-like DNA-binding protein [Mucilaginibacter sp. X4EP1]